jgi:hypothetical protein
VAFSVQWFGATWPSHGLSRGTLLLVVGLKVMESMGIKPQTSPPCKAFAKSALPMRHHSSSYYVMVLNILKFELMYGWHGGPGWGLAPAPDRIYNTI